ncbi:DUF1667 domain-containing protein [Oceanotoga sp. DSM 15011]|jgi:CxxC motif-containing protein|uniref:CxxC motif-containing protein n=1 Tax=Oceanotoga teriensis TaxID=515440 RepID=A0AA45C4I4_9BACT|nr:MULTISPECIES: DUF1667 domain-containing protein [Oceanotoga]MDN5341976.1 hypothetical protein [Oceanotoga sp.]MDO7976064.1 DUF1667 domain-containing protein [Oceanotoga teriensis]PWJ85514.1 CxxC motif-containing protein [Oceanotoga teriensis]UYO98939.1 DUF1667 domain-containing protein [Oceanotoga sp. DSM 15011]
MKLFEERMTCVNCPVGCKVTIKFYEDKTIESIEGNRCEKGRQFVIDEIIDPKRTLVTSILVKNGKQPLTSVKSDKPLPLKFVEEAMKIIRKTVVKAPVKRGDILIKKIYEDVNIISTRSVEKEELP